MLLSNTPSFVLENFEGPLELLLHLIHEQELDVCDISIKNLTEQFTALLDNEGPFDIRAELMGAVATLLLMKSRKLLPEEEPILEETDADPKMQMIRQLIDYCRFKDAATTLLNREQAQQIYFPRGYLPLSKTLGTGLEEASLDDLKMLFQNVLERNRALGPKILQDDTFWHVNDKICWFQAEFKKNKQKILFHDIFDPKKNRGELIVFFLALLELMKHQELQVVLENTFLYVIGYEPRP